MKLIIIYGAIAVGKLTTANELSRITSYPILHNHMTIDVAVNFFAFDSTPFRRLIRKLRLDIVNELLTEGAQGLIWTTGLPNTPDNLNFYKNLEEIIQANGGTVCYVKLICDPSEQRNRVMNEERKNFKKSSTIADLTEAMSKLDFSTITPPDQTLTIDNTNISATEVAEMIASHFLLDKKVTPKTT